MSTNPIGNAAVAPEHNPILSARSGNPSSPEREISPQPTPARPQGFTPTTPQRRLSLITGGSTFNNPPSTEGPQQNPPLQTFRLGDLAPRTELGTPLSSNLRVIPDEVTATPGSQALTMEQAQGLLQNLGKDEGVPYAMTQYDCIYRSEAGLATAIRDNNIDPSLLGRVSTLAPNLSEERLNQFNNRVNNGANQGSEPVGTFTREDPFLGGASEQLAEYFPTDENTVNHVNYQGTDLAFHPDGSVQVGDQVPRYNPGSRVMWSVGHIAMTAEVETPEGTQTMVLDPAISPDRPLTIGEWANAQNYPEGTVVQSGLGEVPELQPEFLSDGQLNRATQVIREQVNPTQTPLISRSAQESFVEQSLENMNGSQRAAFYNSFYQIDEGSALAYENWAGFSIAGPPTGTDGTIHSTDYHAMDPQSAEFSAREDVSRQGLERARTFQGFVQDLYAGESFPVTTSPVDSED